MDTLEKKLKYLVFDFTGKNKEVLSKYTELWYGIKNLIRKIDDKPDKYAKQFMKIRYESSDDLSLNEPLRFHALTLIGKVFLKKTMSSIHRFF